MNRIKSSYGLCVIQCEIINRNSNKREQLNQGDLLRILETDSGVNDQKSDKIIVKLYNPNENAFKTDVFECAKQNAAYVVEALWPYMIGTNDNNARIRIYNERELVLQFKCGDEITIKSYENDLNANIKCVIELIDTVNEVGIGNFIGLKIQKPPQKRETLLSLYKKHLNSSTHTLLFRIEQLLDCLQDNLQQSQEVILNPEVVPFKSLTNLNFTEGAKVQTPVVLQKAKYTNPLVSTIVSRGINSYVSSNVFSAPINTVKSDMNSLFATMASGSISNSSTIPRSRQLSRTSPQTTLVDLYDLNSSPTPNDWPALLKTNNESFPKPQTNSGDLNINEICSEIKNISKSTESEQESSSWVQVTNESNNEKGAIPKTDTHAGIQKKKGRYNQPKKNKLPKDIAFTKTPPLQANHFKPKNPLRCLICHNTFGRDTLVLKCTHCICVQCFGIQISSMIGTNVVRCPFKCADNSVCTYQLKHFELEQLRLKLDEYVLLPKTVDQSAIDSNKMERDYSDGEEELFECKTDKCDGRWFISKSRSVNLYRCPLCKINNCVHCKVVHDNMTCTEYSNMLQNRVRPNTLKNMPDNKLVAANAAAEPRQIPDGVNGPDDNEILMKCKNKKCTGQWFILKIDRSINFNCPKCKLNNCVKCNAIHQNQTCDEYEKAGPRPQRLPYVAKPRTSNFRPAFNLNGRYNNRNANASAKRKWNCPHCTFENFNFGSRCQMCMKFNNIY